MWLDKTVSLYNTHSDNTGMPASYRDILLCKFAKDLPAIIALRKLDRFAPDYKIQAKPLKATLQCYTPAALLESKATGNVIELNRTGIMQLDFDYDDIKDYDLQDLKKAVFNLDFICFCGLSCSGYGFYALALIAEPARLSEYAEHCFEIFKSYGIKPDESKGKKSENLRYLSYDANMLIKQDVQPLQISHFKKKQAVANTLNYNISTYKPNAGNALLNAELMKLNKVQSGERWATVQKTSYTIGGFNNPAYLHDINSAILNNLSFAGEVTKYLKCATVCFNEGMKNPLQIK